MKIPSTPVALPREWPKADRTGKPANTEKFDQAVQAATATGEVNAGAASTSARPSAPPGLERVVAKFEARVAEGAPQGQSQALDRVSRNLARYQENQALAPTPSPSPAPTEPDTTEVAPIEPADPVAAVPTDPPVIESVDAATATDAPAPIAPESDLQTLLDSTEPDAPVT